MTDPVIYTITYQLQKLRDKIQKYNEKANLFGLFSCHILSDSPEFGIDWKVACNDDDWIENNLKRNKSNLYNVAELGYSIHLNNKVNSKILELFVKSLEILKKRNHFDGTHLSFPYQPVTFLGLALGTKHIKDSREKELYTHWLLGILKERRKRGKISSFHNLFYSYIDSELENKPSDVPDRLDSSSLADLSFIDWALRKHYFQFSGGKFNIDKFRHKLLLSLIHADIDQVEPEQLALIWYATKNSLSERVAYLIRTPNNLISILLKFESSMKRWRYDDDSSKSPIRWPIQSEREVQDILWLMLRPFFDDLIDEQFLPKLGHSSYKPDFAIPSLRILLEAKFVRKGTDFKKVEKEILEDSVGYLTNTKEYDGIIVFIYDHSCSVQEHEETIRGLKQVQGIEEIVIVSRPSQLPS